MDDVVKQMQKDSKDCLAAALYYRNLGWSVLPLCNPHHIGVGKEHYKSCEQPGKVPIIRWKEYQEEIPTESDLADWWVQQSCNVGIALGPVSGLVRVDVEGVAGEIALQEKSKGDLPKTLEFKSGRADGTGRGLLYKIPPGFTPDTTRERFGTKAELRFQAKGAETVLPPSRHVSGSKYFWLAGQGPQDMEAALMPQWLMAEMSKNGGGKVRRSKSSEEVAELLKGTTEGDRNQSMASFFGMWFAMVIDPTHSSTARAILLEGLELNDRNDPPMTDDEVKTVFASIQSAEVRKRAIQKQDGLDKFVLEQVTQAVSKPQPPAHEANGKDEENLPDWDLVVVESDPEEFRLRSPYWMASKKLAKARKNGYIYLTESEVKCWAAGKGIAHQAWIQAHILVPPTIKNWSIPEGGLDLLYQKATFLPASPEAKRRLYTLGFIYRYLAMARPALNADGKEHWPGGGRPTSQDGCVFFKIANIKRAIKEAKEDFKQGEIMSLLEEYAFKSAYPDRKRWWKATREIISKIARETGEEDFIERNGATDTSFENEAHSNHTAQ